MLILQKEPMNIFKFEEIVDRLFSSVQDYKSSCPDTVIYVLNYPRFELLPVKDRILEEGSKILGIGKELIETVLKSLSGQLNDYVQKKATETGVNVIDVAGILDDVASKGELNVQGNCDCSCGEAEKNKVFFDDSVHFTSAFNKVLAEEVWNVVGKGEPGKRAQKLSGSNDILTTILKELILKRT